MGLMDTGLRTLSGSKGPESPDQTADNLFSTDVVEVILGISEGPIKGLVEGAKSFNVGDTPLKNANGGANFDNFELLTYKGNHEGEIVRSRLGGFASSTTVSTPLATNVAIVRQGTHTNIDYIDIRMVINQLVKSTEKGTYENVGKFLVEYKAESASTWKKIKTAKNGGSPNDSSSSVLDMFYSGERAKKKKGNPGDRPYFTTIDQPTTTADAAIWFNPSDNWRPKLFRQGSGWYFGGGLTWNASKSRWQWNDKSAWKTDKDFKAFVGTKPLKSDNFEQGDYWINPSNSKIYVFNGHRWIIAGSSLTPGTYGENGTGGDVDVQAGEIKITGKTTSPFPKEFRIPVARINEPYQIRITKTSPINTTEKFFDITWESFQEVSAKDHVFPDTAITQLVARASEQFTSIPEFSGVYDLRIVRVPSNYDPVNRTYAGVWDGTWKLAWTDNAAYVAYDLAMNDRYGMNRYYPITINKWDVYEAGRHCDTLTADGKPRFTFNGVISDPRGGRDMLNYICGTFGGRFFDDGNGSGVIKLDVDANPTMLFSPENVTDGTFVYSFTSLETRHNDITVTFTNPDLDWEQDRRRVFDQDDIDRNGTVPRNFDAVGCTNAKEAIVRARYQLITGLREKMMVNFKTNRQGLYLGPYEVIAVADEDMALGLSGRIKAQTGARSVSLRDPIFLEAGYNYRAAFTVVDDANQTFKVVYRDLTNGLSGALTNLTFQADLPDNLPELAVFSIERQDGSAAPRAFRVLSVTPVDGDVDQVEIQAMEMYRAKWLYIDGIVDDIGELDRSQLELGKKPEPIDDLRVHAEQVGTPKKPVVNIELDWDKSPTKIVKRYIVFGSRNGDTLKQIGETDGTKFTYEDVPPGEYYFEVVAVSIENKRSIATAIDFRLIGDFRDIEAIENLTLVGEPSDTEYESRSPRFNWDDSGDPDFKEFFVRIRVGGNVVRTLTTKRSEYTYRYADNKADNGGTPSRAFTIDVATRDRYGWQSEFTSLSVNNPAPPVITSFSVTQRKGVMQVNMPEFPDGDRGGFMVWASKNSNFTPNSGNLVYDGPNPNPVIDVDANTTYYVIVAQYDNFSKAHTKTGQLATNTNGTAESGQAPSAPQLLSASSQGDTDDQGHIRSQVIFGCQAHLTSYPTETFFDHYDVEVQEFAGGNWEDYADRQPSGNVFRFRARVGRQYRFRVRACDAQGNKSVWVGFSIGGNPNVVTAASDTIKPEKATILAVGSRPKGLRIVTKECAAADYKKTLVFRYNSLAAADAGTNDTRASASFLIGFEGEIYIDQDDLADEQTVWYRIGYLSRSNQLGPLSDPMSGTYQLVKASDLKNKAITLEKLDDASVDTSKLAPGAIEGAKRISDRDLTLPKARRAPPAADIGWSGDIAEIQYTEFLQIGSKVTVDNPMGARIQVAWDFKILNNAVDAGKASSGKGWVYCRMMLQQKLSGDPDSKWRTVKEVKTAKADSYGKGLKNIKPSKGFTNGVATLNGLKGIYEFRVLLNVEHCRGKGRNVWSSVNVFASADANITWRKV